MKICILVENTAIRQELESEHGLSLYIETGENRILFDMGQSRAFLRNAQAMGIDLAKVTHVVLSHGHYDHGGGLASFLKLRSPAKVYISPCAFQPHYHGPDRYIGLDTALESHPALVFSRKEQTLFPGATLCRDTPCPHGISSGGLTVLENGVFHPEDFRHEQYLLLEEQGKRVLVSGCSHRGIVNLAEHFRPDVLIGGFHLMKVTDPQELEEIGHALAKLPTRYYTGHCTGQKQFEVLKGILGDRLEAISTGSIIEV